MLPFSRLPLQALPAADPSLSTKAALLLVACKRGAFASDVLASGRARLPPERSPPCQEEVLRIAQSKQALGGDTGGADAAKRTRENLDRSQVVGLLTKVLDGSSAAAHGS